MTAPTPLINPTLAALRPGETLSGSTMLPWTPADALGQSDDVPRFTASHGLVIRQDAFGAAS